MSVLERAGLALLRRLEPERAHAMALRGVRAGLAPAPGPVQSPRLATRIAGLDLPNPVGLAAGFDKNAEAVAPLSRAGFGFLEVGGATPRPQQGNTPPRVFRLSGDRAIINRLGFNNDGAAAIAGRLAVCDPAVPVGLNLGANRDSPDRAADYVAVLETCAASVNFVTVNVSSPNTEALRDLQGRAALWSLLTGVMDARGKLERRIPVFLKIAPDLDDAALADIADVARESALDGIVATNTTVARPGLRDRHRAEAGGLSGRPLFAPSTRILAKLHRMTGGTLPLIGVGGVTSARDAYAKICAGASAVQLYTGLVYGGLSLAAEIAHGLDRLLDRDGFTHVAQAVGSGRREWL